MNRRKQGDVSWYLPNSKRPFAYSTIAEADTVAILLEEFGDLRAVVSANRILSQQEKIIIQTFIDNGVYKSNIYIMERFELENSREFKAAMELENALNDMCFDYKKFAESIKYFHPTL